MHRRRIGLYLKVIFPPVIEVGVNALQTRKLGHKETPPKMEDVGPEMLSPAGYAYNMLAIANCQSLFPMPYGVSMRAS